MEKKVDLPIQFIRAEVVPSSFSKEKRTIEVLWTTGAKGMRSGWDGSRYFEELSLDPAHVRMERLKSGRAPFLDAHSSWTTRAVIGVVESAEVSEAGGTAVVRLCDPAELENPDAKDTIRKIEGGFLGNISVGYNVHRFERQPMAEGEEVPTYLAVDWEPCEISVVPIGFDMGAGVRGQEVGAKPCVFVNKIANERGVEEKSMPENVNKEAPVTQGPSQEEIRKEAVAAERKRVADITQAVRAAKLEQDFAEKLVAAGVSVDEARAQIIGELAKKDSPEIRTVSRVEHGEQDERQTLRAGLENAILVRAGLEAGPSDIGRRFHGLSLIEMARKLTGMEMGTKGEVATRSLSSSDFPLILGNVAEKMLMKAYKVLPKTFEPFITYGKLVDYKAAKRYQVGDAPSLEEISEGNEYTYGSFGELAESIQLADYGRMLKFTRQMLINDDMQAFQRVIQNFGSAAARKESALVYAVLIDNAARSDGVALFHSDHANLDSAAAISVTSMTTMEQLMMDQTTLDGSDFLGIVPKFLICGTAKKVEAQQVLSAQMLPATAANVNPYQGAMQLIVDPRVTGNKWFLAASPSDIASVELAYLEGESGPVIDSKDSWNSDGVEIKCRHTCAVKALDHRGLVYNPGA